MPAICFYFQVHQPFRIRCFRFSDQGDDLDYFDEKGNAQIFQKVAHKSYLKANAVLLDLIQKYQGAFRVSFSISGVALEQMKLYAPEVLQSFQDLVQTGAVEILAETYYHSLAALYDSREFFDQVEEHRLAIGQYFNTSPQIFRNTELIYHDQIGDWVHSLGFRGILAEGADDILQWRSPNFLYCHPSVDLKILAKNYKLSDDIAFRFSNQDWSGYPLTAEKFSSWIHAISGVGEIVNLFMDYETFGEHQWQDTGIFDFLRYLPDYLLANPEWEFLTPTQILEKYPVRGKLSYFRDVSWADTERDTSAWNGNEMQRIALSKVYQLSQRVKSSFSSELLQIWRRLLTSDHFYYMCTKLFADGDVHAYFSPFKSPYRAFLSFMAILEDFELRLNQSDSQERTLLSRGKIHGEARLSI